MLKKKKKNRFTQGILLFENSPIQSQSSFPRKPWSKAPTEISKTYLTFNFHLTWRFSPLSYRQLISVWNPRGNLSLTLEWWEGVCPSINLPLGFGIWESSLSMFGEISPGLLSFILGSQSWPLEQSGFCTILQNCPATIPMYFESNASSAATRCLHRH